MPALFPAGLFPALAGALLVLCALLLAGPAGAEDFDLGWLAEDLDLTQLTESVDLALGAGAHPTGELAASFAFGGVGLDLHHVEFMGGMARPWLYGKPKNYPLVRSSLADSTTELALAPGTTMPLGFSLGLDEWEQGNRDLRLIAHSGLHLPEVRVDHRLTMTTGFAADGTRTRRGAGRLVLGFNLFGGRQEGVARYDAAPFARLTQLRLNSEWRLDGGAAAVAGITHRPLEQLSEARVGFRQTVGAFDMTSDVVADSAGGYAVGLRFSLPFAVAPKKESWSLSALVANLRAARRAAMPVESEAASSADAG